MSTLGQKATRALHRLMSAPSKFDKPAVVTRSVKGPQGKDMPANQRDFETLRDAIWHVGTFPHGTRGRLTIQSGGKSYGPAEIEQLEKEMKRQ